MSQELLQLFKWLVEHEEEALKRLIARAYAHAYQRATASQEHQFSEQPSQEYVLDFFMLTEVLLQEVAEEHQHQELKKRTVLPALNHIDGHECDHSTLESSANRAASITHADPTQSLEEVFYKELLKSWKPKDSKVQ
jgi:iron only hydrogenase large subunit-like protein